MVKLSLKQIRVGIGIIGLVLLSGMAGFQLGERGIGKVKSFDQVKVDRRQPADKATINLNLFWQVWDRLGQSYLIKENLKPQEMVWGAIKGMTAALGDPYTVFLPPEENKSSKEELDGAFEGVGIELGFKDSFLAVVAPLDGMPADTAGIKAGDYIIHIKDVLAGVDTDTTDLSLPEAVDLIRGKQGTEVELTIAREGETKPFIVKIKRDTIVIKSVELKWVGENNQVAYLKLSRFGGRTEAEWNEAVKEILKQPALKGIILDLRNNPGGYLQGAVTFAGEFLKSGLVVVKQEEANGEIETYSVEKSGRLLTQPLAVLINQGSASSSEILAGALRDYERGKLLGSTSFGKGTVQEALDLGDGAGLHVTTAKWLLPFGQWVNETKGIKPAIEIEDDPQTDLDEVVQKAIEVVSQQ